MHGASLDLSAEVAAQIEVMARRDKSSRVRSGDRRARPALRTLFVDAEAAGNLRVLAMAMHELDPSLIALDRIYPPETAHDEKLLPARMGALIASGHPGAGAQLRRALRSPSLDARTLAELIGALRRDIEPPPAAEDLDLLPAELRKIVE